MPDRAKRLLRDVPERRDLRTPSRNPNTEIPSAACLVARLRTEWPETPYWNGPVLRRRGEARLLGSAKSGRCRCRFPLVVALFLVSGATGLLYEVAFSKLLGLRLRRHRVRREHGARRLHGRPRPRRALRRAPRRAAAPPARRLRRARGRSSASICAVSPVVFEALTTAYVALARAAPDSLALLTAARAALTALVVVIPTVAMGATLPVLSRVIRAGAVQDGGAPRRAERRASPALRHQHGGRRGRRARRAPTRSSRPRRPRDDARRRARQRRHRRRRHRRRARGPAPARADAGATATPRADDAPEPLPEAEPRAPVAERRRPSEPPSCSRSRSPRASSSSPPRWCRRTCSRCSSATAPTPSG